MWSALLSILSNGLSLVAGWFKAKNTPEEKRSAEAKVEQADEDRNKAEALDAFDKGNSDELK